MKWRPSKDYLAAPISYCNGKTCYDKRGAISAANKRYKNSHIKLRVYQCPDGDHFHLTHIQKHIPLE